MEPFDLTLQQVTFEEGSEFEHNVDSFGAVIHYDSHFTETVSTTGSNALVYTPTNKERAKHKKSKVHVHPSKLKSTRIYSGSVCSIQSCQEYQPKTTALSTSPHQDYLINPDHCLLEPDLVKKPSADSSIRTLFQVTFNSAAAKKYQKRPKMADKIAPENTETGAQAFETVADALHLQWSVIGDKKITPASPEEVARIIAETQKKLKGTSSLASVHSSQPAELTSSAASSGHQHPKINKDDHSLEQTSALDFNVGVTMSEGGLYSKEIHEQNLIHSLGANLPTQTGQSSLTSEQDIHPRESERRENSSLTVTESPVSSMPVLSASGIGSVRNPVLESKSNSQSDNFSPEERSNSSTVKETSFIPVHNITSNDNQLTLSPNKSHSVPIQYTSDTSYSVKTVSSSSMSSYSQYETGNVLSEEKSGILFGSAQQLNEVLREKAKLEGQLEMLTYEANETLKERRELQNQIVSLEQKLKMHGSRVDDKEINDLKDEFQKMQKNRQVLEKSLVLAQKMLDEKISEIKNIEADLEITQDENNKLQIQLKGIRDDMRTKDMNIQALKNKIAELYVEVQTHMQLKMDADNECRSAKGDLSSLLSSKQWYQQQLKLANEGKLQLQQELTTLQGQALSQGNIIERLKTENAKIRHQMKEIQQRALKDKEALAKHLEKIEKDMMDRELVFQEIQKERVLLEGTFDTKLLSVEEERNRYQSLVQITNDLEFQLDRAYTDLKEKQSQILILENDQIELNKQLLISEENVIEKDKLIEEMEQKILGMESSLEVFQRKVSQLDAEIWKLKEEKSATEISLKSALKEKTFVDAALGDLKSNMSKVEKTYNQMKQELVDKSSEYDKIVFEKNQLQEKIEKSQADFEKEKRKLLSENSQTKSNKEVVDDLQMAKVQLETEVKCLKDEIFNLEKDKSSGTQEIEVLQKELVATKEKLFNSEVKLQQVCVEVEKTQKSAEEDEKGTFHLKEINEELKTKIETLEKQHKEEVMKERLKVDQLNSDLKSLLKDLEDKQVAFDSTVEQLRHQIREVSEERDRVEVELKTAQSKYEVGKMEEQDKIKTMLQNYMTEVEALKLEKKTLETQLQEAQQRKHQEIQQYQQKLSALDHELMQLREINISAKQLEERNQQLSLDLEKERGRVAGLAQTNISLKTHANQLEESLLTKDSTLQKIQAQTQGRVKEHEAERDELMRQIQELEEERKMEKESHSQLKQQIHEKSTECKKLIRELKSAKNETAALQLDIQQKSQEAGDLMKKVDSVNQLLTGKTNQVSQLEAYNKELCRNVDDLKTELADNLAKGPIIQEEIKSLQWQLSQKNKEVEAVREQMALSEQRQQFEIDSLKRRQQEDEEELLSLKDELADVESEKSNQQSHVTELRTTLKASVQHHKLAKKINKMRADVMRDAGTQVEERDIIIPPLPFDLDAVEKLIQETSVKALERKPLHSLQNCLSSLRSEITGLQRQIDVHTTTVAQTTESWGSVEMSVSELRQALRTISETTGQSLTISSICGAGVQDI